MSELLIGCGASRDKQMSVPERKKWNGLVTLDSNAAHYPDVVHDLEQFPYPFDDNQFDEIHAYCVLEHTGRQGDWEFFFAQWSEFYRILKRDGLFFGLVPKHDSVWAWGDPSHKRVMPLTQLNFLSQEYYKNVGKTSLSDFRHVWKGDFAIGYTAHRDADRTAFVLRKL